MAITKKVHVWAPAVLALTLLSPAVAQAAALPSPPWLADAERHLACALRRTGDEAQAAELEQSVRAIADRCGLAALVS